MRKGFGQIISVMLTLALGAAVLSFAGCAKPDTSVLRLEAEKAIVVGTPSGEATMFIERTNSNSDNSASGKKFVSHLGGEGNTLSWVFMVGDAGETDLFLRLSNGTEKAAAFDISDAVDISVNGEKVELPYYKVAAASKYCDSWQTMKVSDVAVYAGYNSVVLTSKDSQIQINVDYLDVGLNSVRVSEHEHDWDTYTVRPTCTASGGVYRECKSCRISYPFQHTKAVGHSRTAYHFDEASGKMVRRCNNGCGLIEYADAPGAEYFGEVFDYYDDFSVRPYELVYEAESARVDISAGGLNNGSSYIEEHPTASGGKLVANISKPGNYVEFTLTAEKDCTVDLVFVCANTLYMKSGIGVLDPLSRYMSFTVGGIGVDFSYVAFPGSDEHNYYDWHYVVMKNITLKEGKNSLIYKPILQPIGEFGKPDNWVTVPNLDVLLIYSDEQGVVSIP